MLQVNLKGHNRFLSKVIKTKKTHNEIPDIKILIVQNIKTTLLFVLMFSIL